MRLNKCVKCGYKVNRAYAPCAKGLYAPKQGDLTICLKCGEPHELGHDLELIGLPDDHPARNLPVVQKTQEAIKLMNQRFN